jgi:hypothetical protein
MFTIKTSNLGDQRKDGGGMGWFANQDMDPGVILLEEEAFVIGPASPNACVECFRFFLKESNIILDT